MAIPAFEASEELEFGESTPIARDFILLAYADTRKALKQDFVGTSKNKRQLKILAHNDSENKFDEKTHDFEREIIHIIPGDFKQNGELSFMVCFKNSNTFQVCHFSFSKNELINIGECDRLPMIISIDDWIPAVILQLKDSTSVNFFKNNHLVSETYSIPRLSKDHSSAYIDLNGDLRPDLALVTAEDDSKNIEIFLSDDNDQFRSVQTLNVPDMRGPVVFADFRGKGLIDIAYLSEENYDWYLNILFNTNEDHISNRINHKRSRQRGFSRRGITQTTTEDNSLYMTPPFSTTNQNHVLKIDLKTTFPGFSPVFCTDPRHYMHEMPTGLMVADITLNRYPDLILLMKNNIGETTIKILENCLEKHQTFYAMKYQPQESAGLLSASICDYTQTHHESIIVNCISNGEYSLRMIPNPYSTDRLRLTITVLQPNLAPHSFSSTVPGISCLYTVEEVGTVNLAHSSTQFSHLHLQRPFCILGLGSMSYSGSMLSIGGPCTKTPRFYNKVMDIKNTILPNSDLVAFPEKNFLKVELYLQLGKHIFNIIAVLIVLLLLNLLIVAYSVAREKRRLLRNRKKEPINFNLGAL